MSQLWSILQGSYNGNDTNSPTTASSSGEETKKSEAWEMGKGASEKSPFRALFHQKQVILRSTIAVVLFNWGTTYESSFTFYNSKVKGDGYDVLQWHVISSNGHPSMCINKDSTKHDKTDVLSAQFLKLNLHLKAHTAAGHNKKTPVVNNASQHCDKYHRFRSSNESHLLANLYHLLKLTHALLWTPPIPAVCSLWCYQRGHHTGQHVYS